MVIAPGLIATRFISLHGKRLFQIENLYLGAQPYNDLFPIIRILVPLIPQPALSQQQAEIPGNLKAMLLNVTALFSFLKKF